MSVFIRSITVLIALIFAAQNCHVLIAQESATITVAPTSQIDGLSEESIVNEAPDEFVSADIAWMLVCSALVLMMTAPGLALFYGGLVRKKNILSVMMQCIFLMGLMSILWAVVGYSLAFGGTSPYFGNFDHVFLAGVTPSFIDGEIVTPATGTLPTSVFMCFQGMFFIITPALICGAFAERLKFSTMCIFMVLWGLLIYCPICHWVWSDSGWLCEWNAEAKFPALDFAGGTVVHISSGVSAL
ncbi:ammonia channel protein, partial [bacterium]|nr:ammonia channel protein [bacterium]